MGFFLVVSKGFFVFVFGIVCLLAAGSRMGSPSRNQYIHSKSFVLDYGGMLCYRNQPEPILSAESWGYLPCLLPSAIVS